MRAIVNIMFACCYSTSSVLSSKPADVSDICPAQAPSPLKLLSVAQGQAQGQTQGPLTRKPLLGAEPGPVPNLPLNKVQPPTPDLTEDEIAKIQANLRILQDFNQDLWTQQGALISEVWSWLKNEINQNPSTDNKML
jgi:hypothetical protein